MAFTIVILLLLLSLALYKWLKWKITALSAIAFAIDKFRASTKEEDKYYLKFVLKEMLHFSEGDKNI